MLRSIKSLGLVAGALLIWLPGTLPAAAVTYERDVSPLLNHSCAKCHGDAMAMAGLKLNSEAAVLEGGKSGPAIVPGKSGDSLLIKRVLGLNDAPRMPMGGDPLTHDQVALLQQWIDQTDFTAVKKAPPAAAPAGPPDSSQSVSPLRRQSAPHSGIALLWRATVPTSSRPVCGSIRSQGVLKGSESGKVVVPGHSDDSRVVRRLLAKERPQMPYGGPPLTQTANRHHPPVDRRRRARTRFHPTGRFGQTPSNIGRM